MRLSLLFIISAMLMACASHPISPSNLNKSRRPAQEAGAVTSQATPLYTWSRNPQAAQNPRAYVESQLAWAHECIGKIARNPPNPVEKCEGNGLAAGPGIYTCDNPFMSHDYGSTVVILQPLAHKTNLADGTGLPPAEDIDRALSGNAALDGILYDFRASDLNTRAVVVRGPGLLDLAKTKSVQVAPTQWKRFREHGSLTCTSATAVEDVLSHWGDQLEFLAFTFMSFKDPDGAGFAAGDSLNRHGFLAATASDAVAMPDGDLKTLVEALKRKFPELEESLSSSACEETEAMSLRKCLFLRIFSSIIGDQGTGRYPTYSWSYETTEKVLRDMNFLTPSEIKQVGTHDKLVKLLASRFPKDPNRLARAKEAFQCMKTVRERLTTNNLQMWMAQ